MSKRIIDLKNITKSYGQVYALGGVDLHVDEAEVVGLVAMVVLAFWKASVVNSNRTVDFSITGHLR